MGILSQYLLLALCAVGAVRGGVFSSDPCRYKGNNFTIDLRDMIKFPQNNVPDMKSGSDFTYRIDLCKPLYCNDDHQEECACQHGGEKSGKPYDFSLGQSKTAEWEVKQLDPLDFSIKYSHGDASDAGGNHNVPRSAVFYFTYSETPRNDTIANTDQNKDILQYEFTIRGKHVEAHIIKDSTGFN